LKEKVIVFFNDNWADEIEFEGFKIIDKSEWEDIVEKVENYNEPIYTSFGSNQEQEYENGIVLLNCYGSKDLTETEAKIIIEKIGYSFGEFGPIFDVYYEILEEGE